MTPARGAPAGWRSVGRVRGALIVTVVHLLLGWWLSQQTGVRVPTFDARSAAAVAVRLLPLEATPSRLAAPRSTVSPSSAWTVQPSRRAITAPTRDRAIAPTAGTPTDRPVPAATADAPLPPASPPALPPATVPGTIAMPPLDLHLHPNAGRLPSVQQQAVHDARSNTRPLNFDERIAHDLNDRNTSERLADGSIRHRHGADCVIEHPARTAQLFPIDETSRRAPSAWGPCP